VHSLRAALFAHTAQALFTGRYPLLSLMHLHYPLMNFPIIFKFPNFQIFKLKAYLRNTKMTIQKHFLFSLGLTSMSDASSFRDAMLSKIVLAQY
jgi:hypothetical protein